MAAETTSNPYSKAPAMLAGLALVALAACLYLNFQSRRTPSKPCTLETLRAAAAAEAKSEPAAFDPAPADAEGVLRVVYLPKAEYRVGQPVCLAVAGVSAAGPHTVELTPFLNNYRADAAKTKVQATDRPQAVELQFGSTADATAAVATFWRNALSGGTDEGTGVKSFALGLTRSDSGNSELQQPPTVTFRIYDLPALAAGAAAMLLLAASVGLLAARSTLLRDNSGVYGEDDVRQTEAARNAADAAQKVATATLQNAEAAFKQAQANPSAPQPGQPDPVATAKKALEDAGRDLAAKTRALEEANKDLVDAKQVGQASGAWSLGRTQMALWMLIVVGGFLFLWLSLGEYTNVVNSSILILLGLNSATGLLAVQADKGKNAGAKSKSFLSDLINDGNGPQLQRIQVLIWTIVLAIVFLYNLAYNFLFVQFDTNLLLLMGIAQATYLGFKTADKEPAKDDEPKAPALS